MDLELDGKSAGTGVSSYREEVQSISDKIDYNLNVISTFVDSLKTVSEELYIKYANEYNDLVVQYRSELSDANYSQSYANDVVMNNKINNLNIILGASAVLLKNIQQNAGISIDQVMDENAIPESIPEMAIGDVIEGENEGTDMVTASPDTIDLSQVSVARSFWEGLSPASKNILKAIFIAAAIYGAKKGWDYFTKKAAQLKIKSEEDGEYY